MKSSKTKGLKSAHTPNTPKGMGDFYGTGLKQKLGRVESSYMPAVNPVTPKKLKTPPKKLA